MSFPEIAEFLARWLVLAGTLVLMPVILTGWLRSYRGRPAPEVPDRGFFALPSWMQIGGGLFALGLLIFVGYWLWEPLPLQIVSPVSPLLDLFGALTFLAGLSLTLWARFALGDLFGVSTTTAVQLQSRHRLITHGPYRLVRHPMYLGYWLMLAGAALVHLVWALLVYLGLFVPVFYRRARVEDAALSARFGAAWEAHAEHTKFIIPFIY